MQETRDNFSFVLLGDIHYDKKEHHDFSWLAKEKPGDIRQIENYSKITATVLPALMQAVRREVRPDTRFVLQIGDVVEGLAGTPVKAIRHCEEAVAFVRQSQLSRPFLFVKGNHDVTGPGAVEAFDSVLLPFLSQEAGMKLATNNFVRKEGNARFVFYDAYRADSLDVFEENLKGRTEKHLFVVIHPPVAPYGARSNWHQFAKPTQARERSRFLELLGEHRAIVLCGHLHKWGVIARETKRGKFVQVATVSVLPEERLKPKDEVRGVSEYGASLVRLEASFSPETVEERRALLEAEKPFIRHYEYADAPGYGVVSVAGDAVSARFHAGVDAKPWRTINLTELLS